MRVEDAGAAGAAGRRGRGGDEGGNSLGSNGIDPPSGPAATAQIGVFSRPRGSLKPAATPKMGPKWGVSEEPTHPLGFLPPPRPLRPANRGGREMPVMPRPLRPANDANGGVEMVEPLNRATIPRRAVTRPRKGNFCVFRGYFAVPQRGRSPAPLAAGALRRRERMGGMMEMGRTAGAGDCGSGQAGAALRPGGGDGGGARCRRGAAAPAGADGGVMEMVVSRFRTLIVNP